MIGLGGAGVEPGDRLRPGLGCVPKHTPPSHDRRAQTFGQTLMDQTDPCTRLGLDLGGEDRIKSGKVS